MHVQQVVDAMLAAGPAPRTTAQAYRALWTALRQAVRWQLLGVNPAAAVQPPRGAIVCLILATSLASCLQGSTMESESRVVGSFSYVDGPESIADLEVVSDILIFAQPTSTPESRLREYQDLEVMGQQFEITEVIQGQVSKGSLVTVIRLVVPGATIQEQPPYDASLYLMALKDTEGTQGVPAWYPVGGPTGRVPFRPDPARGDLLTVEVGSPGDPIQEALAGQTPDEVMETLSGT